MGRRRSGVGILPVAWSTPLITAGLGSAKRRFTSGQQRLGEGPALVELAGQPALDHGHEPLGGDVGRGGDGARPAHEHGRVQVGVVAAEDGEPSRGAPASTSRVSRSMLPTACFTPAMLGVAGQRQQRRRPERPPGAVGDVVDDERDGAGGGHRLEVLDDPGLRRPHVVRHHRQGGGQRRSARRGPGRPPRRRRCCWSPPRRSAAPTARAQALAQTSMTACFSSCSSAAASRWCPSATMPAAPASRNPWARRLQRLHRDAAVSPERRDGGDIHPPQIQLARHTRKGTLPLLGPRPRPSRPGVKPAGGRPVSGLGGRSGRASVRSACR